MVNCPEFSGREQWCEECQREYNPKTNFVLSWHSQTCE